MLQEICKEQLEEKCKKRIELEVSDVKECVKYFEENINNDSKVLL